MKALQLYGRLFFATGFIAFGIMHFIFGDFITGRAPAWPEQWPGQYVWAVISGMILIIAGVSFFLKKLPRYTALISAAMIFLWAVIRHIPFILSDSALGGVWTQFGKSVVFFSGILAISASYPPVQKNGMLYTLLNSETRFIQLGTGALAFFMILCGIQHFLFVEFVASLIPPWIPGAIFWTYAAGILLIAGGTGLLIPVMAKLAALLSGIMVFSWVFLVHIPLATSASVTAGREWIAVFEALAVSGLAFFLAGIFSKKKD